MYYTFLLILFYLLFSFPMIDIKVNKHEDLKKG